MSQLNEDITVRQRNTKGIKLANLQCEGINIKSNHSKL
jgi:hypothetical protein